VRARPRQPASNPYEDFQRVFSKFASAEEVTGAAPAEGEGDEEAKAEPVKEEVRAGVASTLGSHQHTMWINDARVAACKVALERGGGICCAKRAALSTVCRTALCYVAYPATAAAEHVHSSKAGCWRHGAAFMGASRWACTEAATQVASGCSCPGGELQ